MHVGLRHFDSQTLGWLAGALRSGEHTRHALARELCERTGWRNSLGDPCLSAVAKALPALSERIGIDLPAPREVPDPAAVPAVPAGDVPDTRQACPLDDLGPVSLVPVDGDDDRRLWEAMMAAHHPLAALARARSASPASRSARRKWRSCRRAGTAARTRCPCSPSRPPRPRSPTAMTRCTGCC